MERDRQLQLGCAQFSLELRVRSGMRGADFTGQLDAIIDAKIARGQRIDPDCLASERVWLRLRNAAARLVMPYL